MDLSRRMVPYVRGLGSVGVYVEINAQRLTRAAIASIGAVGEKSRSWWWKGWAFSQDQPSQPLEQGSSWAHFHGSPAEHVLTHLPL